MEDVDHAMFAATSLSTNLRRKPISHEVLKHGQNEMAKGNNKRTFLSHEPKWLEPKWPRDKKNIWDQKKQRDKPKVRGRRERSRVGAQTQKTWGLKGQGVEGWGPEGWGPKVAAPNSEKVWPPRVGGPKFRAYFFPLPPSFSLFLCLSGCLLVEFWWCF